MNAKAWIMTVPVLSTAHITADTAMYLKRIQNSYFEDLLTYDLGENGFMVYVGDIEDPEDTSRPDLKACFAKAIELGANGWMRFDSAGTLYPELPTYYW